MRLFSAHLLMIAVQAIRPTVLITGSTDGIGLTTAKNMAIQGYHVIVHGRDETRINRACDAIRAFVDHHREGDASTKWKNKNKDEKFEDVQDGAVMIESVLADLSTVRGCELLASGVTKVCRDKNLHLAVLMNNAGVYSEDLITTSDGTELTFAVNVVAPFVLTSHLLPELLRNNIDKTKSTNMGTDNSRRRSSRIVIASSISQCRSMRDWDDLKYQKRTYSAHGAYSESKLCDAMLAKEFAERLQGAGYGLDQVTCNSLDPGTVNTKMLLAGWGPCGIDVEDALDETYLCSSPEVEGVTGSYFRWRSESRSDYPAREREKLWNILSDVAPSAADMWKFDWK
jgi:NAD(P)-dependent dehydrogenase (short-subunit alcohol dehydrogenase family)